MQKWRAAICRKHWTRGSGMRCFPRSFENCTKTTQIRYKFVASGKILIARQRIVQVWDQLFVYFRTMNVQNSFRQIQTSAFTLLSENFWLVWRTFHFNEDIPAICTAIRRPCITVGTRWIAGDPYPFSLECCNQGLRIIQIWALEKKCRYQEDGERPQ